MPLRPIGNTTHLAAWGRRRPAWTLLASLGIWVVIGVLIAQQSFAMRGGTTSGVAWWRFVAYSVLGASVWGLATPGIIWLVRRAPFTREAWRRAIPLHLAWCTAINGLDALVNARFAFMVDLPTVAWGTTFVAISFWSLSCYIGVAAIVYAMGLDRRMRSHAHRSAVLAEQLATARLAALQSQIHPHFLFNTLNSIAEQIWEDREKADRMVLLLGSMLRTTLGHAQRTLIPVREEVAALEPFLELVTLRHQGRLITRLVVDPAVEPLEVPPFILQPLVENAVLHGMEGHDSPTTIQVEASMHDDTLHLVVSDDGAGLPGGRLEHLGIGLSNTSERLQQLYGDNASLTIAPRIPRGVVARLVLPIDTSRPGSSIGGGRASHPVAVRHPPG